MKEEYAKQILAGVRDSYQTIAGHFDKTRYRDWPEFAVFKKYIKSGDFVLDAGCGNGRLYDSLQELKINYTGIDLSSKLIELAQAKYPAANFQTADLLNLPFDNEKFDVVISIASWHHLPSVKLRCQAVNEAKRVLKKGGYLLVTVWNLWQKHYWLTHFKFSLKRIFGQSQLDWKDLFWPWKNPEGKVMAERYCHAFTKAELVNLVKKEGFKVVDVFYSRKGSRVNCWSAYNLCLIAQKEN